MSMNYRNIARDALERAKLELDKSDDYRLRYSALELRMALESLIYERAGRYTEELSSKKLSTWQPHKLLSLLLEIDPYADKTSSISIGTQEEYGKPAKDMRFLGKARVLSLIEIKKYYDRLGSYLHTPTLDQVTQGKIATPEKIRTRCNEVVEILNQVLASPIFNADFRVTSSLQCIECGAKIVRRIPPATEVLIARCLECSASYSLTDKSSKQVEWLPQLHDVECANPSCSHINKIWDNDLKLGTHWSCPSCEVNNEIVLALVVSKL